MTTTNVSNNPVITGTVQAETRKFESNLSRLLTQKTGESKAKMIALAIVGFIPAALSDVVRFALFKAKLIDGKSFSLIDKTSATVQTLSTKVNTVWNDYKNPSLAVRNERSEKVLNARAKDLVKAYIALDRNFLNQTKHSFGSLGEQAIKKAQNNLLDAIEKHLQINVDSTVDVAGYNKQAASVKAMVEKFITAAAGGEVYIKAKTVRVPNAQPLALATVIKSEFSTRLKGSEGARFATVSQTQRFIPALVEQKETKGLRDAQVKKALETQLSSVYSESLQTSGLNSAGQAVNQMLTDAVKANLITKEEAPVLAKNIQVTPVVLGLGAAKDLVDAMPAQNADADARYILAVADHLVAEEKLEKRNESIFCSKAKAEAKNLRAQIAAEKKAYAELNKEVKDRMAKIKADKKVAKEQEEAIAQALVEAAEKQAQVEAAARVDAENKSSLLSKFMALLGIVSKSQKTLSSKIAERDAKAAEFKQVNDELKKMLAVNVDMVSGGTTVSMKLLDAAKFYYEQVAKINGQEILDAKKQELKKALVNNDNQTMAMIKMLQGWTAHAEELNDAMAMLSKEIVDEHATFVDLFNIYEAFTSKAKILSAHDQKDISKTAKDIASAKAESDKFLPASLKSLLKGKVSEYSLTKDEKQAIDKIVDDIIAANITVAPAVVEAPLASEEAALVSEPKPSALRSLWNALDLGLEDIHAK